jgi:UDP-N-acetylmuramoyl-tripeptide--D-alanyl-D-alanine ligase
VIETTLGAIADVVGGVVDAAYAGIAVFGPVVTDSREAGPGSLFVARTGEHADGHDFADEAAVRGAVAALGTRQAGRLPTVVLAPGTPGGMQAADVALGLLTRDVLARSTATVVAVTGSSGKTSTKDLLAAVLATAGPTVAARESYNSEVGVPLTALRVSAGTAFVVLEMGARASGQLKYLTTIAPPDISVVLNVGSAHLGEFGSREAIAAAKSELVAALRPGGLAVLNADDPVVAAMRDRVPDGARICWTGESPGADVRAVDVAVDGAARASFTLVTAVGSAPVSLLLHGAHHVGNALAAAAVAVELGLGVDAVAAALSAAIPTSRWRMEVTRRDDRVTIVNDAYNANPESMRAALQALATMTRDVPAPDGAPARSFAVLGEMRELGAESVTEHDAICRLAVRLDISKLIAVGEGARAIHLGALQEGSWGSESAWVADLDAARELLEREVRPGDVVLVKSSRDAGLRRLGEALAAGRPA